jgi:hypothetical protein
VGCIHPRRAQHRHDRLGSIAVSGCEERSANKRSTIWQPTEITPRASAIEARQKGKTGAEKIFAKNT